MVASKGTALHSAGDYESISPFGNFFFCSYKNPRGYIKKQLFLIKVLLGEYRNVDGTCFPDLLGGAFDRILVDAPCSSDGTVRKEPKRLQRWSMGSGLSHHELQLRLLRRGLALLRPGGRLVYSTCSINPLECEAVVQAALVETSPDVRLIPAEAVLPEGCPRGMPGLSTWSVPEAGGALTLNPKTLQPQTLNPLYPMDPNPKP